MPFLKRIFCESVQHNEHTYPDQLKFLRILCIIWAQWLAPNDPQSDILHEKHTTFANKKKMNFT